MLNGSIHARIFAALAAIFVSLVTPVVASAHDVGVMTVTAIVSPDRTVRVEFVFDAEHLPAALQVPGRSGTPVASDPLVLDHLQRLALAGCELSTEPGQDGAVIALHITQDLNAIDGSSDQASRSEQAAGITSAKIRFSLTGKVAETATEISWCSSLPVGQYLYRVRHASDEESVNQWLDPGVRSANFRLSSRELRQTQEANDATAAESKVNLAGKANLTGVVADYLKLGYTHILPLGLDHIMFVLGLFFLGRGVRPLLTQVTAFTAAHSITLGLAACNVVRLPASVVEPLIAASIAFVAIENVFAGRCTPWRTAVVFCFGLLHGLGFAGVLQELGLPQGQFFPALISFNIGVEFGQLTVIATAYLAVGLWHGSKPWYRARIANPASMLIALMGLYWTAERMILN